MNVNEYYKFGGKESPPASVPMESRKKLWDVMETILTTRAFRIAIPAHLFLQFFVEHAGFFKSGRFQECNRICGETYEFSATHRDAVIFILGAFVINALLYLVRIYLTSASSVELSDSNRQYLKSYSNSFVIAVMPCISMTSVLLGNAGGTCVDTFGVYTPASLWSEWLVSVPCLVYVAITVDSNSSLTSEESYLVLAFFLCILCGFCVQLTKDWYLTMLLNVLSLASFMAIIALLSKATIHLKALQDFASQNATISATLRLDVLTATRKLTLARCISFLCPIFPGLMYLARFKLIDNNTMMIGFWVASALTKILFCALCTDAHLELTHPAIYMYEVENKSNLARRAFLRYVFHEVRVPLNSISLGIQLLTSLQRNANSVDLETFVMISEAASHIGDTLNDVMVLQKIEEGSLVLLYKPFLLKDLIANVIEWETDNMRNANFRSIRVLYSLARDLPEAVSGDKFRISHVLNCLLSNALKFSEPHSEVFISIDVDSTGVYKQKLLAKSMQRSQPEALVSLQQGQAQEANPVDDINAERSVVVFTVVDHGRGIPADEIADAFVPFLMTRPGELKKGRGSGVSLAIAKEIVEKHGGIILCESTLGKGSTFRIAIPFAISRDNDLVSKKKLVDSFMDSRNTSNSPDLLSHQSLLLPGDYSARFMTVTPSGMDSNSSSCATISVNSGIVESAVSVLNLTPREFPRPPVTPGPAADSSIHPSTTRPASSGRGSNEKAAASTLAIISTMRALVVDDVLSNRKLLSLLLQKRGIQNETAEDGLIATEKVKAKPMDSNYDVIFLDNTMPNMTGIECATAVRKAGFPNIIVGVTGNSVHEELADFAAAGADIVLTKPLQAKMLDQLLLFFDQNGIKSRESTAEKLIADGEKLIWVPIPRFKAHLLVRPENGF